MFSYVTSVASLASSNLRSQKDETIKLIYPRISVLGILGMPAALLFLLLGTALWISAFFLVPLLLICVWLVLQPWRLYMFFQNRMTGKRFFV